MEKIIKRQGNILLIEYESSLDGNKVYYLFLLPYYQRLSEWRNKKRALKEYNKMLKAFEGSKNSYNNQLKNLTK